MSQTPRTRLVTGLAVFVLVVIALGVGTYMLLNRPPSLPTQGTAQYEEFVETFQVGVAALDADKTDLAQPQFDRAIAQVPQEPAAWANRGLMYLRLNQPDKAAADLKKANALAPEDAEIEALLGLLDQKQNRFDAAAVHYRKAIAADPKDLASKYALAQTVNQAGGPDAPAEYQRLLEDCLQIEPNNLWLLRQRAIAAVNRKDLPALKDTLARYRKLAPDWSAEARRQLDEVEKAAEGALPGQVPFELIDLDNQLKGERGYTRSQRVLEPNPGYVGRPLYRFVKMAPPRPSPAPPDLEITFTAQADGWAAPKLDAARWEGVWTVFLDGTGQPAVFVANGRELRRADADGPALPFPGGPKAVAPSARGVVALDWNNDYRTDLLLAGAGGLRFLQQDANGGFSDVTAKTGLTPEILGGDYYGAWAVDIDMDGDLDVILAPRTGPVVVLRNNRDGTYKAMQPFPGVENVRAFAWADFDNDGAPDAAFLDAQGKLHVFANERSGQFKRRTLPANGGRFLAVTAADITDAGAFDLLALRDDGAILRLTDKDKGQGWEVAELVKWADLPEKLDPGVVQLWAADVDNNGALDLIVAAPAGGRVWLGEGGGKFSLLPAPLPAGIAAVAGLTDNGRLDLLGLSGAGQPVRLVNKGTKAYHWQVVRPHATAKEAVIGDNRINTFALGGEVEARSGTLVQKRLITAPQVHFGLGERTKPDVVRVLWPNGTFQAEFDQKTDQVVEAEQRLKGSCPFLFAWDGQQMAFVTDFMWSTPLGMYINAQDKGGFLQTTDWVKIRGDQLVPRDGYYDLRVTANLWETHYYDYMALMVVDHPADTEVFVDERFFLTPATPQVFVTDTPRPVAHAWDDNGADVTEIVRATDGRYLDTFGRGRFQGVTRDHWVEVDLGDDAPTDGPLWLLARGWVHPTDSSINWALDKGTNDKPRGLVLEVPDGKGGWTVGAPALGFPSGKDKTILIRLDGITGPGVTRRFRLRTNMEIYWDSLAYARGRDAGKAHQQWLAPTVADLQFRGILEMTQADKSSPEVPHYDRVIRHSQHWRDLIGYYTRFGDVRELLAQVDDRYVIMNGGDEIAFRFPVPEGPPSGWQRDFVWACDGWAKDGDLNTRFSKTVLPLPAHDIKTYVTPPGRLQEDPVYRRFPKDWQNYHTRYVTTDVYDRGLRPNLSKP